MNARELLLAAAELLSEPGTWTQGARARDRKGGTVMAIETTAVCWCVDGALVKAAGHDGLSADGLGASASPYAHACRQLDKVCDGNSVRYNDEPGRTQEQMVAKLHLAARVFG